MRSSLSSPAGSGRLAHADLHARPLRASAIGADTLGAVGRRSGFLEKKSRHGRWQKRWFAVHGHYLVYSHQVGEGARCVSGARVSGRSRGGGARESSGGVTTVRRAGTGAGHFSKRSAT